jgi:DNA-binding transcriptional LysR family regulator
LKLRQAAEGVNGYSARIRVETAEAAWAVMMNSDIKSVMACCVGHAKEGLRCIDRLEDSERVEVFVSYHASRREDPKLRYVMDWLTGLFDKRSSCLLGSCPLDLTST